MNSFVFTILLLVIVATYIAALVFATSAAKNITDINTQKSKWSANADLKSAHTIFTWMAVGGWISVVLILVALVMFFITGGEISGGGMLFKILIFMVTVATLIVGILGIIGAQDLKKSVNDPVYAPVNTNGGAYAKARKDSILAASLGIGVIGFLVLLWIVIIASRKQSKDTSVAKEQHEEKELERKLEREKDAEREKELNNEKVNDLQQQEEINRKKLAELQKDEKLKTGTAQYPTAAKPPAPKPQSSKAPTTKPSAPSTGSDISSSSSSSESSKLVKGTGRYSTAKPTSGSTGIDQPSSPSSSGSSKVTSEGSVSYTKAPKRPKPSSSGPDLSFPEPENFRSSPSALDKDKL